MGRTLPANWLVPAISESDVYVGTPAAVVIKRQQYRMIFDYTLLTSGLRAHVHCLELVQSAAAKHQSVYIPIRFQSMEKTSTGGSSDSDC
jgi:hypothetical protein